MTLMGDMFKKGYTFDGATGVKTGANLEDLVTRATLVSGSQLVDQDTLEDFADPVLVDDAGVPIRRLRVKAAHNYSANAVPTENYVVPADNNPHEIPINLANINNGSAWVGNRYTSVVAGTFLLNWKLTIAASGAFTLYLKAGGASTITRMSYSGDQILFGSAMVHVNGAGTGYSLYIETLAGVQVYGGPQFNSYMSGFRIGA